MKSLILMSIVALMGSSAFAGFDSTSKDLVTILSDSQVKAEMGQGGDVWSVRRIQSAEYFGYQISTEDGCKINALIRNGSVIVYPKSCK